MVVHAFRVRLTCPIETARSPEGEFTKVEFSGPTKVPARVVMDISLAERTIYLLPGCGFDVWGGNLNLQYLDIPPEPGEAGWGPKSDKLLVSIPLSDILEYGPVYRPTK